VKDRVELNDHIFRICEKYDLPSREDKQNRFGDVYQLMTALNHAIYDTKDKADKRKDQMKRKIHKKIPKLNARVAVFVDKVSDPKFLKMEKAEIEVIIAELDEIDREFNEIATKKKKIQIYQRTMDMGATEPFNNVEDARILVSMRCKLWKSIYSWRENV
jgi:dynein heavy chain